MPADTDELAALRADVQTALTDIQALKQAALSPSSRISLSLAEFYKMVAAIVVTVSVAVFWLTTSLSSLKSDLSARMDTRFDALSARLDTQSTSINAINVELATHTARFDAVNTRLDAVNTRLDRIETEMKRRP